MVQRTRFFSQDARDQTLPISIITPVHRKPGRSKSAAARLFSIGSNNREQQPNFPLDYDIDYGSYGLHNMGRKPPKTCSKGLILFGFTVLCVFGAIGAIFYERHDNVYAQLEKKQILERMHLNRIKVLEAFMRDMHVENEEQKRKIKSMEESKTSLSRESQRKLFFLEHYRLRMHQGVQLLSKRLLQERYGSGPKYYIEIKIAFDPESNIFEDTKSEGDTIILETAGAEMMPHSIFFFLEMVSHGVYDDSPWHRNAIHVLQAGPSSAKAQKKSLREPSLQSVIFQEFSTGFSSHEKYTIGFPGRPGGPDFYINMKNNNHIHGPGGQAEHYGDIVEDADPCFARVIKGFKTVDRLHRSEVDSNHFHDEVLHPATIQKMTILKDYVPEEGIKEL